MNWLGEYLSGRWDAADKAERPLAATNSTASGSFFRTTTQKEFDE
jgi:hypothetical protein